MRFWRIILSGNINVKINLIVILTVLASYLCVFTITYSLMENATMEDKRERASSINEYIQQNLDIRSFSDLDLSEDESGEIYENTRELLNRVRHIANIQYLYTTKLNESNTPVYLVDGLETDDPDFRHIGDPIESELLDKLYKCFSGIEVSGTDIISTEWGNVYVTYWPVIGMDSEVLGAIGMEFNADYIVKSYRTAGVYSVALSALLIFLFILISRFLLKKVSEPFYKKLAYYDYLTGLQNRMAFEERIKECADNISAIGSFTLIIFDLNDLKKINDSLGHRAGDIYIKNSALLISERLKGLGQTYRIGGDELSTIITGKTKAEIKAALKNLYAQKQPVMDDQLFDCAYGMATFNPKKDKNLHAVFDRADALMYEKKRENKSKKGLNT